MASTDSVTKSLSAIKWYEGLTMALFILMIFLPYSMPYDLGYFIDSTLGMLFLFFLALLLFYFYHPLLGILFLILCYDLLRRASTVVPNVPMISYTPSQDKKDFQMAKLNPTVERTLEEDIIAESAPNAIMSLVTEPSTYLPISAPLSYGDVY